MPKALTHHPSQAMDYALHQTLSCTKISIAAASPLFPLPFLLHLFAGSGWVYLGQQAAQSVFAIIMAFPVCTFFIVFHRVSI